MCRYFLLSWQTEIAFPAYILCGYQHKLLRKWMRSQLGRNNVEETAGNCEISREFATLLLLLVVSSRWGE